MDIKNLSIVRQSYANTVFTHKVQEVAAAKQDYIAFKVKITNIVLVGIVLVLLFLQGSQPENIFFSYAAAGVTIAEVIFLIIQLSFSFEQRAVMHKSAALKYLGLRDRYRSLIVDIMNESISSDEILSMRESLRREYQIICDLAPQTGNDEYDQAQEKLNARGKVAGEEYTWSDEEIDRFLPESLRMSNIT